jgi:hypothetical protein
VGGTDEGGPRMRKLKMLALAAIGAVTVKVLKRKVM